MKNYYKNKNNKGYAILFTIIIVGIILAIATGMSDVAYKEIILSSVASDSQVAFYQADTAAECGLYVDQVLTIPYLLLNPTSFTCGRNSSGIATPIHIGQVDPNQASYYLGSKLLKDPCFDVTLDLTGNTGNSIITANGYNVCDKTNTRTVERSIKVTY